MVRVEPAQWVKAMPFQSIDGPIRAVAQRQHPGVLHALPVVLASSLYAIEWVGSDECPLLGLAKHLPRDARVLRYGCSR